MCNDNTYMGYDNKSNSVKSTFYYYQSELKDYLVNNYNIIICYNYLVNNYNML